MVDYAALINLYAQKLILYAPKLVTALITLLIGWWIIGIVLIFLRRRMEKSKMEPSLHAFFNSMVGVTLKILLLVSIISMLGVQMTSFIAIIGAAGLAIGLALQGSLGNFAGGVLILLFKPFKVGDVLEAQGHVGKVSEIQIFNTILKTPDNKTVIIPNGNLSNSSMVNFSTEPTRRVDFSFGIAYNNDVAKARKLILDIVKKDKRVLKDPEPMVKLGELADSSVNLTTRVWVDAENYWDVFFDTQEAVKNTFDKNKINIPFPQMDVHLTK